MGENGSRGRLAKVLPVVFGRRGNALQGPTAVGVNDGMGKQPAPLAD